jgi:hypothetical protein
MPAPAEEELKNTVRAMLIAGEAPKDIEEVTGLSRASISRIKQALPDDVFLQVQETKFIRLQDKITDHLEHAVDAMSSILTQFDDPVWRETQDAQALATAYGIIADKSVRIIEGVEAANIARENEDRRRKELTGEQS